jgi:hypothetical protein
VSLFTIAYNRKFVCPQVTQLHATFSYCVLLQARGGSERRRLQAKEQIHEQRFADHA